jgi:hypothetical protein
LNSGPLKKLAAVALEYFKGSTGFHSRRFFPPDRSKSVGYKAQGKFETGAY